jgi:hypothetical protein
VDNDSVAPVESLELLAKLQFGELSAAEKKLLQAAPRGDAAYCGPSSRDNDPANDPAKAEQWGSEREIRAELICWLCVDRHAKELVDPRGIQVYAAKISGTLNLPHVNVPFPLILACCSLNGALNLRYAEIVAINLHGTWVHSIAADGAQVKNYIFLRNGFHVSGQVRLLAARIGGTLECDGGRFENPVRLGVPESGLALIADGAIVNGAVFLRNGFSAAGEVRLLGAQIGGYVDCTNATFKNPPQDHDERAGIALNADNMRVKGSVFLRAGFHAEGEVRLPGAQIGGDLDLQNASISNPRRPDIPDGGVALSAGHPDISNGGIALTADRAVVEGSVSLCKEFRADGEVRLLGAQIGGDLNCESGEFRNPGHEALSADRVRVTGSVFLRAGFTSEGEVRLLGAEVGGNLECDGGTLKNPGHEALSADGVRVAENVFLRTGFTAQGDVRLLGAKVGGNLFCGEGTFTSLNAHTAAITGTLYWMGVKNSEGASLDLTNASAGALADDESSWPKLGNLSLDGFTYTRILYGPDDAGTRLEWLERSNRFTPQPYRQLAKVLRETGDDRGARLVLFEMERLRRREKDRNWRARLWSLVLKKTIGYGQMPGLALWWLVVLMAVGFLFSYFGYFNGAIRPTDKDAYYTFESRGHPPDYYPRFHALVYSLEHSFPLVNLGQKDRWAPNPQGSGHPVTGFPNFLSPARHLRVSAGFLRVWLFVQVILGWALATLFVAGLTGVVKSG